MPLATKLGLQFLLMVAVMLLAPRVIKQIQLKYEDTRTLLIAAVMFSALNVVFHGAIGVLIKIVTLGLSVLGIASFLANVVLLIATHRLLRRFELEFRVEGVVSVLYLAGVLTAVNLLVDALIDVV